MSSFSLKSYSSLLGNLFFTSVQVYGLFFLNWSGLYIVYLYWIELLFLAVYTSIRYKQLVTSEVWYSFKKLPVINVKPDKTKDTFIVFVLTRISYLLLYLMLIGVTAVPIENGFVHVKTLSQFWQNLIIADPVFLGAVFFIAFFYLKAVFSKAIYTKEDVVEYLFNLEPLDKRYLVPMIGLTMFPIILLVHSVILNLGYLSEGYSNTYLYAICVLLIRLIFDLYLSYRIGKELQKNA